MKNSKLFKKAALLLAVLSLAVVLVIGTLAIAAAEGESADGYGETYYGVRVSTDGDVNVKFYYSSLGTATEMIAEVDGESFTYANNENLKTTVNGVEVYCINVPLRANQMASKVVVYANGAKGEKESKSISVQEYVESALKIEANAEYYDALRAMANWGAMAQTFFAEKHGTEVGALPNVNLFVRDTNPVNGVVSIASPEKKAMEKSGAFTGNGEINVHLEEGDVYMSFEIEYTGDVAPSAIIKKGETEVATLSNLTETAENLYVVEIHNIGVAVYDEIYEVTMTAGEDSITVQKSMLEYLNDLVTGTGTPAQKNVAKSMYQFYQTANGVVDADCTHTVAAHWNNGEGTDDLVCSSCFAVIRNDIPKAVDAFHPGVNLTKSSIDVGDSSIFSQTGKVDDGEVMGYARFTGFSANNSRWFGFNPSIMNTTNSGRYLVLKYRMDSQGLNSTRLAIFASTKKSGALVTNAETKIAVVDDAQWHTVVVDLATRISDPSGYYKTEEDGSSYILRYLQIRPFDDKQTTVSSEAYFDLEYIALCDDAEDIKGIVEEDSYECSAVPTSNATVDTESGKCISHRYSYVADDSTDGYHYECGNPRCAEKVPGINFFLSEFGHGYHGAATQKQDTDGVTYYTLEVATGNTGANFQMISSNKVETPGDYSSKAVKAGRYLAMKVRVQGAVDVYIATEDKCTNLYADNAGSHIGELAATRVNPNGWAIVVVDLEGLDKYSMDATQKIAMYTKSTVAGDSIDIMFTAIGDSKEELVKAFGMTDTVYYDFGKSFSNTPVIKNLDGTCSNGCNYKETVSGTTHTIACAGCGTVARTFEVSADINYRTTLDGMSMLNQTGSEITYNLYDPDEKIFYNNFTSTTYPLMRFASGSKVQAGTHTSDTYATGEYIVMKIRAAGADDAKYQYTSLTFYASTGDYSDAVNTTGASSLGRIQVNKTEGWVVAVIKIDAEKYTEKSTQKLYLLGQTGADYLLDVAYVAVVDNIAEAESLLLEGESYKYYETSFTNGFKGEYQKGENTQ